jgi:PAS domain S-box-containing protein
MTTQSTPTDETMRGDRCLRDIVALTTLPLIWSGAEPPRITESLAAALFATVGSELVYVSLAEGPDRPPTAVAQIDRYETSPAIAASLGPVILEWARSRDPDKLLVVPSPLRPGTLHVLARPVGLHGELGVIAVACDGESPAPFYQLVLNVAVTQATIAIQNVLLMRSLRESEEHLRAALASAHAGCWEWDARTDRRVWSEECYALFGIAAGERVVSSEDYFHLIHPDDRARHREDLHRLFEQRVEDFSFEYRILHSTLGARWVHSRGRIRYDADGAPLRAAGIIRDITEQKRIEQERELLLDSERAARAEAERASRMKDEFLAMISHELRTPLSAILGWTQLLRRPDAPPAHRDRCLEVIERNTRLQAQLISDLLDVNRITAGKLHLDLSSVDLPLVVEAAIDACRAAAEAKQVMLVAAIDPASLTLWGDSGRMQQVVTNLITNAIKFTPRGGTVTVSLARRDERAEIVVRDTGQGIAPEFLPRIFDRFSQAESSKAHRHGGLGLGLSIVEHLVRLHGGEVRAESAGLGLGATFTISLPCEVGPSPTRSVPAPQLGEGRDLYGARVLVVDDEADARELAKRVLQEHGATVVTAASGQEAIDVVSAAAPDVLVSDLGMPGVDGYELVRAVRAKRGPVPAVAVTGFARPEDRLRALSAGYEGYLTKPIDPTDLVMVVARLLNAA